MLPVIKPVGQIVNPRSAVIYGLPGTGKTTLFSTWPKPLLLLDMNDKGTDSISDVKGVDVAQIESPDDIEAVYWMLKKDNKKKYKSVGIDTTTQAQQLYIEETTGDRDAGRWGSMTRRQFGDVAASLKKMVTDYRDLPMNVVFLAQQRTVNLDEEGDVSDEISPEIGPALMPSIATHLNASVSIICQTFIRKHTTYKGEGKKKIARTRMEYCLYVGPNPVRITKIRKPKSVVLPSFLVNPTYEDLIDIVEGEK